MQPIINNNMNVAHSLSPEMRKSWSKLIGFDIITLSQREDDATPLIPGTFRFIITKGEKETEFYWPSSGDNMLLDEYINILSKIRDYRAQNAKECDAAFDTDPRVIKRRKELAKKEKKVKK